MASRALFDCVWIECEDMEFSLSPCCRGLLCPTISNPRDSKKARKWNTLGHAVIDLGENGSVIPRRGPEVVPPGAASLYPTAHHFTGRIGGR